MEGKDKNIEWMFTFVSHSLKATVGLEKILQQILSKKIHFGSWVKILDMTLWSRWKMTKIIIALTITHRHWILIPHHLEFRRCVRRCKSTIHPLRAVRGRGFGFWHWRLVFLFYVVFEMQSRRIILCDLCVVERLCMLLWSFRNDENFFSLFTVYSRQKFFVCLNILQKA